MIRDRHPVGASTIVNALKNDTASQDLDGVEEFEVPQWRALALGLRAACEHEASSRVEREFRRSSVLNRVFGRDRALLRSQRGPVAGVSLSSVDRSVQGVASAASCPRVGPFEPYLHFWPPPCSVHEVWGVLGRRGFALESAAGRVYREGWARVATNQFVQDLDLGVPNDNRQLEVACFCSGSNSPWTQPSFLQFEEMANQCRVQLTGMAWH